MIRGNWPDDHNSDFEEVIKMWFQSPPVTNRWVLHVAATPEQVGAVLREMCIDGQQPRHNGDEQFPVYLQGANGAYGPPQWMSLARAELNRRGYPTRWCTPACRHHPWPPRTVPQHPAARSASTVTTPRERGRPSARDGSRTPLRRLTSGVPHHRASAARTAANQRVTS